MSCGTDSRNILVTGFGPFGYNKVNASWESVKILPEKVEKFNIIKHEIPVSYKHVERDLARLWEDNNPKLVVHVGVSSLATKITIETCAHKSGYLREDCYGKINPEVECPDDIDECLKTAFNIKDLCDHVNKLGFAEAVASEDAGRYLCEFIFFTSLCIDKSRCLFVHVPQLDEPYSVEILARALEEIIKGALLQINLQEKNKINCD